MPKLYEYLGLAVFFYANEHDEALVRAKADEIIEKWVDFFVRHKHVQTEIINQRIK